MASFFFFFTCYGHSQNSLLVKNYSLLVGPLAALPETFSIEFKLLGMEHKTTSYLPRPTSFYSLLHTTEPLHAYFLLDSVPFSLCP